MLTCPNCGTTDLRGSYIVEGGVDIVNTVVSNPKMGIAKVRRGEHNYENSTGTTLVCKKCKTESPLTGPQVEYDVVK